MAVAKTKNRFLRESRAAARLNHSAIVRVLEADENPKIAWQVCDAINGRSLAAFLSLGRLQPEVAARLMADLADAVSFAHRHGVVHRDIKPENILIQLSESGSLEDSQVFLTDFGLAKISDEAIDQSRSGTLVGTPRYMAPEQFDVSADRVSPLADIYALGAVLYECLTGESPFGLSHTLAQRISQGLHLHPSPRKKIPNLSTDLETICLKAMHPDTNKRYQSAAAMAEDLRLYQRGLPILARSQTIREKLCSFTKAHQLLVSLTGVIMACLSIIAVVSMYSQAQLKSHYRILESFKNQLVIARDQAQALADSSENLRLQSVAEQQKFESLAWSKGIREAYRCWEESRLWETHIALQQLAMTHTDARQRIEWQLLATELNQAYSLVLKQPGSIEEVRALPNSTQIALVTDRSHLVVTDLSSRQVSLNQKIDIPSLNALAVHPTQPLLFFGGSPDTTNHTASLYCWDLNQQHLSELVGGFTTTLDSIEICPGGRHVLCGSRYQNVRLIDLDDLTFKELPSQRRHHWLTQFRHTSQLAYQLSDDCVGIVALDERKIASRVDHPKQIFVPGRIEACAAVPQTSFLAVSWGEPDGLTLVDIKSGQAFARLVGHRLRKVRCMTCSEDGRLVIAGTENGDVIAWDLELDKLKKIARKEFTHPRPVSAPVALQIGAKARWHVADSPILSMTLCADQLACGTQSGDLISIGHHRLLATGLGDADAAGKSPQFDVAMSPQGDEIALRHHSGTIYLLDVHQLQQSNQASDNPSGTSSKFGFAKIAAKMESLEPSIGSGYRDICSSHRGLLILNSKNQVSLLNRDGTLSPVINLSSIDEPMLKGLSPDGKWIAFSDSRQIHIASLETPTANLISTGPLSGIPMSITWHPAETKILIGGDLSHLYQFDYAEQQLTIVAKTHSNVERLQYILNGTHAITGHQDGTIRITDLASGTGQAISAHNSAITGLLIHESQQIGLSVDNQNNVVLWKFPQLEKIGLLLTYESPTNHVLFVSPALACSPDFDQFVLIYNDQRQPFIRVWNLAAPLEQSLVEVQAKHD